MGAEKYKKCRRYLIILLLIYAKMDNNIWTKLIILIHVKIHAHSGLLKENYGLIWLPIQSTYLLFRPVAVKRIISVPSWRRLSDKKFKIRFFLMSFDYIGSWMYVEISGCLLIRELLILHIWELNKF